MLKFDLLRHLVSCFTFSVLLFVHSSQSLINIWFPTLNTPAHIHGSRVQNEGSELTHLLPEVWLQSQAGAGGDKPAVSHNSLVQVVSTDALHKQTGFIAYLLQWKR